MTVSEFKAILEGMSEQEFLDFRKEFGGDFTSLEGYVGNFVHDPKQERRLCQILGVPSEDEKLTGAAMESAQSAKDASESAKTASILAGLALVLSAISFIFSIFKK